MKTLRWYWNVVTKAFCFGVFGLGAFFLGVFVFPLIIFFVRLRDKSDRIMRNITRRSFTLFILLIVVHVH